MTTNEICNMQNYLVMSSREIKYIKNITFKHVNGSIIQNYAINKDMTFNHMFEELKKKICYDFEFENFEIVPDSGLRERGLELIQSLSRFSNINDLFVYNIINDDSRFYVRPIGTGSDTISSVIDCQSEEDFNNCPVCTIESQINTHRYFNCSHLLCSTCYTQWSEARRDSILTCPTCRSH